VFEAVLLFIYCERRVADVDTITVVYVSTDFDAMLSYIPSKYYFLGQQNEQQADKWNRPAKVRTTFAFSVQNGLDWRFDSNRIGSDLIES